jgi:hypothetical protein
MIKEFQINKLKYDFMGYTFNRYEELSFHHLIVPKRDCKAQGLGDGYLFWNGAILKQDTSHDYLHIIERIDRKSFLQITDIMVLENKQREIDIDSLKRIREILLKFEYRYQKERTKSGQKVLKRTYINNRIELPGGLK